MEETVLEFAACCRANAMRVSTAEVLDCLTHLRLISSWDEASFHSVLKTNFAKSRREQAEFDRMFNLFFKGMKKNSLPDAQPRTEDLMQTGKSDQIQAQDQEMAAFEQFLLEMADQQAKIGNEMDHDLLAFMAGKPQFFIERIHQIYNQESTAAKALKSNMGQLTSRLQIMLAAGKMRGKIAGFMGSADSPVADNPHRMEEMAKERLDRAMAFLNESPGMDSARQKTAGTADRYFSEIGEIPFANLTHEEMSRVKDAVDQWVKKLKDISTLRFSAARKGKVDVPKTIRRSGRYLGVPIEIIRKDRALRKGKIVTLCDISGSVWSSARFMLNILYSLQSCFTRVKSHVFIDQPVDVTPLFDAHDANTAIKKILKDPRINYNARTDYGMTFQGFRDLHLQELDKKTTLIILGDGRSNYQNPREPVLELFRERCRRLIWLNPEQEQFWGTGDSEMPGYRRYCNEARPCGNLNQLIDFIQELIL